MSCGCRKLAHAAGAWGKALFSRQDHVSMDAKWARQRICEQCEHARLLHHGRVVPPSMCGECGCVIVAKTLLRSEACPLGKWASIE